MEIGLLGPLLVEGAEARIARRRERQVLTALALRPDRPVPRTDLIAAVWDDDPPRSATKTLQSYVARLRQLLGADAIETVAGGGYRLRVEPGEIDVVDFERLATAGRAACSDERWDDAAAVLTRSLSLWRDDSLPEMTGSEVLAAEATRLREMQRAAAEDLVDAELALGHHERLVGELERSVRREPLRERGWAQLMVSLYRSDRQADALRAYDRARSTLVDEIGVEPGVDLRELQRRVLDQDPLLRRPGPASPADVAVAPREVGAVSPVISPVADGASPALVGRRNELALAEAAWVTSTGSRPQLLLVSGEPGVGKTRLIDELAERVAAADRVVARVRAYEGVAMLPWGPVCDLLRSSTVRPWLAGLARSDLDELARLVPELGGTDGAERRGTLAWRHRLLLAICRAVTATDQPRLIVIDDLQWCDADTLEAIGYVLLSRSDAPLLVAATARTGEIDDDHPAQALITTLAGHGALTRLPLDRLDRRATEELVETLVPEPRGDLVERAWRESEGNPLFVVELARMWASESDSTAATATVAAVITARLRLLSRTARELAEVAATVGRTFSARLVASVLALDEGTGAEELDELWRRGIVREAPGGDGTFEFTHDRLRQVTYDTIGPARRQRLHRRVADSLAAAQTGAPGAASREIAAHYERGGAPTEALDAYQAANQYALSVYATEDAVTTAERALALVERWPRGPERDLREAELRVALAVPLVAREGYGSDAVVGLYQGALALTRRAGARPDPAVLRGVGLAALMTCDFAQSGEFARELIDSTSSDPTAEVEGHYLYGVTAFWRGDIEAAREHLQTVLDHHRADLTVEHLTRYAQDPVAVCAIRLSMAKLWQGDEVGAAATAEEALDAARALDHPVTLGYVLMYAGVVALELGQLGTLEQRVTEGEVVWRDRHLGYFATVGALLRGWVDARHDRADTVAAMEAVLDDWRAGRQTLHLSYGLLLSARVHARAGRLDEARRSIADGLAWGQAHDQAYLDAELWRLDGELLHRVGRADDARDAYRRAQAIGERQGAHRFADLATRALSESS